MVRSSKPVERRQFVDGWDFSPGQLMTPLEVARVFRVDPKTVSRWSDAGKLVSVRTPGGVRRFSRQQVEHLASDGTGTGE